MMLSHTKTSLNGISSEKYFCIPNKVEAGFKREKQVGNRH